MVLTFVLMLHLAKLSLRTFGESILPAHTTTLQYFEVGTSQIRLSGLTADITEKVAEMKNKRIQRDVIKNYIYVF